VRKTSERSPSNGSRLGLVETPREHFDTCEALKGRLALPVPEVAKLLGISSAAVRLMIARGNLPGRKVGGGTERMTYIVPTQALMLWLEGKSPGKPEDAA